MTGRFEPSHSLTAAAIQTLVLKSSEFRAFAGERVGEDLLIEGRGNAHDSNQKWVFTAYAA
jgi:hypothetical protein